MRGTIPRQQKKRIGNISPKAIKKVMLAYVKIGDIYTIYTLYF